MYETIIRGGKVVDGSGAPWFHGDIGIRDGVIAKIGSVFGETVQEIDAHGLFVSPGFIDIHTHSDESVIVGPESFSKLTQGVTTEVVGNCGYSPAPAIGRAREEILRSLAEFELKLTWQNYGEYLNQIRKARPTVNIYPLVGQGTLISAAGGGKTPSALLEDSLTQGARGMSTGLIYPPGCFSSGEDIAELCLILAQQGGIYTSHIRSEEDHLLEAVVEAIEVGSRTGVKVEISHLKAAGPKNFGRTEQALELISSARDKGIDVAFDAYPYTASSTGLTAFLPNWAHEGGRPRLDLLLRDASSEARLSRETEAKVSARGGWDALQIAGLANSEYRYLIGQTMGKASNGNPWKLAKELLLTCSEGVEIICFAMDQEDVDRVICHPLAAYGSDATSRAPVGVLAKGKPHPRAYGTFPRILAEYVRKRKLMPLEEAIRKMTSAPAARLGLTRRGLLRPGMAGDIVIFDLMAVQDNATYLNPHQVSSGIQDVLVNGSQAYSEKTGVIQKGMGEVLSFEG